MRTTVAAVATALVAGLATGGALLALQSEPEPPAATAAIPSTGAPEPRVDAASQWSWLQAPGQLVPGARIHNTTAAKVCSAGWLVRRQEQVFLLTAGHCGHLGDTFAVATPDGEETSFGVVVETVDDPGSAADYALIQVFSDLAGAYRAGPGQEPVTAAARLQDEIGPGDEICRLGFRTGLSCGALRGVDTDGRRFRFAGVTDHGDSGGPVFLRHDGEMTPLGIVSGSPRGDDTLVIAEALTPVLHLHDLELIRS